MYNYKRITIDPNKMGGVPCIRDLRMPISTIIAMLAEGYDENYILAEHSELEKEDIKEALRLSEKNDCDSVISVIQVFNVHPILMKRIENNQLLPYSIEEKEGTRRQDYSPPAYMRNGAIYLTKRDVLMNKNSIWGNKICPYIMPPER